MEIELDESGLYLNKIYIHINNVTSIDLNDTAYQYVCGSQIYDGWVWRIIYIYINQDHIDRHPSILLTPNEETAIGFYKYNEVVPLKCQGRGMYQTVLFWTHNGRPMNRDAYRIITKFYDRTQYSNLSIQIKALHDYGEYCCVLSSTIGKDASCVSIYSFPIDYLSLDNLQRIVFSTFAITTVLLIIFIPGIFIQRITKNVICIN